MKKNKLISLLLVLILFLSLYAYSNSRATEKRTLNVGVSPSNPPFSYKNINNELVGFDIDFINSISESIGYKINFVEKPTSALIPSLLDNQYDIALSGISKSLAETTSNKISTSTPYYQTRDIALTKFNSPIKTLTDLNNNTVGVVSNSLQEKSLNSLSSKNIIPSKIHTFNSNEEAILQLQNGAIDAVIVSNEYFIDADFEDITMLSEAVTSEPMVIVTHPENIELNEKLDNYINTFKSKPIYNQLIKEWFLN